MFNNFSNTTMGEGKFIFNPENQDTALSEQSSDQNIAGAEEEEVLLIPTGEESNQLEQDQQGEETIAGATPEEIVAFNVDNPQKVIKEKGLSKLRKLKRKHPSGVVESSLYSKTMYFGPERIYVEKLKSAWPG